MMMDKDVERINAEALARYSKLVSIQLTAEGTFLITLDGHHYVNDAAKLNEAMARVLEAQR